MVANVRPDIRQEEAIVQHVGAKAGEYGRSRERALTVSQGDTSANSSSIANVVIGKGVIAQHVRWTPISALDFLGMFARHDRTFFRE